MTNAAGAAVSCAVKYGGRPAVFVNREELNEIKLKISSMPKAWIGKNVKYPITIQFTVLFFYTIFIHEK